MLMVSVYSFNAALCMTFNIIVGVLMIIMLVVLTFFYLSINMHLSCSNVAFWLRSWWGWAPRQIIIANDIGKSWKTFEASSTAVFK